MTYSPIPKGTQNWDVPLNAALLQLDSNVTAGIAGALQASNNLSDVLSAAVARNNLGISAGAAQGVNQFNVKDYGAVGNGVADDTTAIQNAINAANAIGGAVVYMPPGNYKISAAITLYNHITLIGAGDFVTNITQTSTSANGLVGDSLIYVTIKSLRLTGPSSGTGEGIAFTTEFDYCILEDITVTNWGSTGIDIEQPIVSNFTRVTSRLNGGAGMYLHGSGTGAGTSISLNSCWMHDNTSNGYSFFNMTYCAFVACAADNQTVSGKAGYLIDTCSGFSFSGCGSENNNIGMKFTGIGNHTVQGFFNYANPSGGIGFYITGSATNINLTGIAESTPNGAATNWIKTDTGTSAIITGSVHTTANSFAASTIVSLENVSGTYVSTGDVAAGRNLTVGKTSGLGDNGAGELGIANATTVPTTNPTNGALMYATGGVPLTRDSSGNITDFSRVTVTQTAPGPSANGLISWNYEPQTVSGTAGVNTSGTVYLHKIYLPANKLITSVAVGVQTAGSTLTAGQNFVGVYNSAGTRLGVSADQAASWTSTGFKSIPLAASFTTTAAGFYFVGILAVGTTPPAFYQAANAPSALFNANLATGTFRHSTGGTAQTSLPTTVTFGGSSTVNSWVAVL